MSETVGIPAGTWRGSNSRQTSESASFGSRLCVKDGFLGCLLCTSGNFPHLCSHSEGAPSDTSRALVPHERSQMRPHPFGSTWSAAGPEWLWLLGLRHGSRDGGDPVRR